MTSIYSNNYYNDNNDWGFYVEMDDIPAPIYIISHPLPKRYKPITVPPQIIEEEIIISKKYNNYSTSFLRQISSINIIRNPVTKIATVLSILITSLSSLLFSIEIVKSNDSFNSDYN